MHPATARAGSSGLRPTTYCVITTTYQPRGEVLVRREVRGKAARREAQLELVNVEHNRRDHRDQQVCKLLAGPALALQAHSLHGLTHAAGARGAEREIDRDTRDAKLIEDHLGRARRRRYRRNQRPLPIMWLTAALCSRLEQALKQPRTLCEMEHVA